jgi:uncharacterized protein (TIGR02246 family)
MTRDEILTLVERRAAALAARDPVALAATHAENGIVISPTGGVLEGRADIEAVYGMYFAAFPDMVMHRDQVLIDGDRVVLIARFRGTHSGEFFGLVPTGRQVEVQAAIIMRVADGVVVEERRIYDFTGVLVQVGVLKAKPTA